LLVEDERADDGRVVRVATVFLTGRECPWRCVMCDLWTQTTITETPEGAIPVQLAAARRAIASEPAPVTQIKLYNSGSFFDPRAVPEVDYEAIAVLLHGFERVIVESHPALIGPRLDRFAGALPRDATTTLEVAMGLETAHPVALAQLNKGMTVSDFGAAADRVRARGIALRCFLLIGPPFITPEDQDQWLLASIAMAVSCGASVVSLIPTRTGNGAFEPLVRGGLFRAPRLDDIERSQEVALACSTKRTRVFVDVWDLDRFADCRDCFNDRRARLRRMNLEQRSLPRVLCEHCIATAGM
jgi:radical SAM enzyme (TIGR01210 family)